MRQQQREKDDDDYEDDYSDPESPDTKEKSNPKMAQNPNQMSKK